MDGAASLGNGTLDGSGRAVLTTSALAVGSHTIKAIYNGAGGFATSTSSSVTQVVNLDSTATTVTSSLNPSVHNKPVTFTATVAAGAPGTGTPAGSVTFKDGTRTLGTASLTAGRATFSVTNLSKGSHPITAVYAGSSGFGSSTSPVVNQTVN